MYCIFFLHSGKKVFVYIDAAFDFSEFCEEEKTTKLQEL